MVLNLDAFYIHWGSNVCPAGETKAYSGHIVESSIINDADGNYLCLPDAQSAYPQQALGARLNLEDTKDTNGKTIPCAACAAIGRSAVLIYPDNSMCPNGWHAEYSGYYAANPKWPGENICVDTTIGTQLSKTPCEGLAVIAKGPFNASSDIVSCVVCTI